MEKHVYFVRHGESETNADRIFRGKDARLTDAGREQARAVAERIQRIGIDALISSTFPRAHDTAVIIGERVGLPIESNELFGEWEGPSTVQGRHRDHPEVREIFKIIRDTIDPAYRHGDEETFLELSARAEAALKVLEHHPAERLCVVTHGGFLKLLTGVMVFRHNFNKELFHQMVLNMLTSNTGITYAKRKDEQKGWQVISWNDQSHLG